MKRRYKFLVCAAICVVIPALLFGGYNAVKREEVRRTQRQLEKEGFKTDLAQFERAFTPESLARGQVVLPANIVDEIIERDIRIPVYQAATFFRMHTSNSVVVPWAEEYYAGPNRRSPWPAVRQTLEKRRAALDAAISALIEGPIAFREIKDAPDDQNIWVTRLPSVTSTLSVNMMSHLYYGERLDAWTNLIALTRLVTRLEFEPIDYRQRTHLKLIPMAYDAAWYALQDHGWTDQQLASLDDEWAHADFFREIPTSLARQRACLGPDFDEFRHPKNNSGSDLNDLLKEPRIIPSVLKETSRLAWYRWGNSYDDERNALLFLRDREIDLRRAVQASNVIAMRALVPATNAQVHISPHQPNYPAYVSVEMYFFRVNIGRMVGSLGLAADAEIRLRLIRTAIALERFKLHNGAYPQNLTDITNAPQQMLIDFADGKPLRYHRTEDGHFLLYSVGLDGIDNNGDGVGGTPNIALLRAGTPRNIDVLWPLPAHFPKSKVQNSNE